VSSSSPSITNARSFQQCRTETGSRKKTTSCRETSSPEPTISLSRMMALLKWISQMTRSRRTTARPKPLKDTMLVLTTSFKITSSKESLQSFKASSKPKRVQLKPSKPSWTPNRNLNKKSRRKSKMKRNLNGFISSAPFSVKSRSIHDFRVRRDTEGSSRFGLGCRSRAQLVTTLLEDLSRSHSGWIRTETLPLCFNLIRR
jgi:hypothetical protein